MVDGVRGCVDHVVGDVMVDNGVLEVVTNPNLCVEEETVLDQVIKQDLVVVAVRVRL